MINDDYSPDICLYHANCLDGFTSAWVVQLRYPEIELLPVKYQDPPPFVVDKRVMIVDFCYPVKTMHKLAKEAKEIVLIDHHENAAKSIKEALHTINDDSECCPIQVIYDNNLSGCGLTWRALHHNIDPPKTLLHIQDYDLFQFKLSGTREIVAAIKSYQMKFPVWRHLMLSSPETLIVEGSVIERYTLKLVNEIIKNSMKITPAFGESVPVCPMPYQFRDEAGSILSIGFPFSATYFDTPDRIQFSLRSQKTDGADVSEIARRYGGNGHKNAAGFSIDFSDPLARKIRGW